MERNRTRFSSQIIGNNESYQMRRNSLLKAVPSRLLSYKNLAIPAKRHTIFHRKPESILSDSQQSSTPLNLSPIDDYYGDREKYIERKQLKPSPVEVETSKQSKHELNFDSHFECGNLLKVFKHREKEYVLVLENDIGTQEYSNWYYFSARNSTPGDFRFHIINIRRFEPLVDEGLSPAIWSSRSSELFNSGWSRGGYDVKFSETSYFQRYIEEDLTCYTLSFSYSYKYTEDTVYFAYSYPYTYSYLQELYDKIRKYHSRIAKIIHLSSSLMGNSCECLVIADNAEKNKQVVVLTGRVHPGETASSYIVHGLIEFLLSSNYEAAALRNIFTFYIVPMLNPDGVRHGNYRCSALGVDLNRRWKCPNKTCHPTIFQTKQLVSNLVDSQKVAIFCDFHGHSKKKSTFMYGCSKNAKDSLVNKQAQLLISMMEQACPSFSQTDTHYRMDKSKDSTARIVMYKEFKIVNSYTLESSVFGKGNSCYSIDDYLNIGVSFAKACFQYAKKLGIRATYSLIRLPTKYVPISTSVKVIKSRDKSVNNKEEKTNNRLDNSAVVGRASLSICNMRIGSSFGNIEYIQPKYIEKRIKTKKETLIKIRKLIPKKKELPQISTNSFLSRKSIEPYKTK